MSTFGMKFRLPAAAVLLVLAGLAAYHGTFSAPFFFDDLPAITDNPSIRDLRALGAVLSPQSAEGNAVGGRPLVNLSFAINYALGGLDVRGYHAVNLAIHLLAGLTLLGLVRRTLTRLGIEEPLPFAFAIALLWVVHPLQTESVTCVVQRTESLMGLFYLLTLYGFVRAADENPRGSGWALVSVLACFCGMATKEVMVTAPVIVLLYDRAFVSGTFREGWRRNRWLHLAFGSSWLLLAVLLASAGGSRGASAGFGHGVSSGAYALTQCRAIVHYLRLAFWPHPLVVDYGTGTVTAFGDVARQAALLAVLAAGTVVALWRRSALGFLGAWFFVILSPSSSVVPLVTQTIAEHRMYLPLAAVIAAVVMGLRAWLGRYVWIATLGIGAVLAGVTAARNRDYSSVVAIWGKTVAQRPENARARTDFGDALRQSGQIAEAIAQCREAVRLQPTLAEAHCNLGSALLQAGQAEAAAAEYETALRLRPNFAQPHVILAGILLTAGQTDEALTHYAAALRFAPAAFESHYDFGNALFQLGRPAEAAAQYRAALAIRPDSFEAQYNAGNALVRCGDLPGAIALLQGAVRRRPESADAHFNLADALARAGHPADAAGEYRMVLRLEPGSADARARLGELAP
jgi:tetratricopeptide (TPR) repeat protein